MWVSLRIFGFATYTVHASAMGLCPKRLSSKDCPSKTPAPLIKGISLLLVAVPAGLVK